jgi:transketolase C-terminal domain/subunit
MRKTLSKFLTKDDYLIYADMWRFKTNAIEIDCGLGESNLLNIAGGIASQNKTVYIYGVAGFIIYRYEQLKFTLRNFGSLTGKIIICNAGKFGYDGLGAGHNLDDDLELMKILKIPYYCPNNVEEFKDILNNINTNFEQGIFYIQLGKDE